MVLKDKKSTEYPEALHTLSWVYWVELNAKNKSEISDNAKLKLYSRMTTVLTELLNNYPEFRHNDLARFRLGEIAYYQQAYVNAVTWYTSILTSSENKLADKAHYRLAWCYTKLADTDPAYSDKALAEFLNLCKAYPQSPLFSESALHAGKILRQREDYTQALKLYKDAESRSSNPDIIMGARYGQGITLLQLEEYSKALRIFKEYLTSYPQSPLIHEANWAAGQAALMLGANEDAKDFFIKAKADNYNGEAAAKARYGLGIIAMDNSDFEAAREEFRKIDVFHSQWQNVAAAALLKAAEASKKLGELSTAENDLNRIIEIYANTPSAQTAEEILLSETNL